MIWIKRLNKILKMHKIQKIDLNIILKKYVGWWISSFLTETKDALERYIWIDHISKRNAKSTVLFNICLP